MKCDEEGILQSIRVERAFQDKKWGGLETLAHLTDKDMLCVLVEEVGEVAMALNDNKESGHPDCLINKELIQVAASAVKMMALRAVRGEGAASWKPGHPGHRRPPDPLAEAREAAFVALKKEHREATDEDGRVLGDAPLLWEAAEEALDRLAALEKK